MTDFLPLLSLAFVSGIATSFQPCIFPLLPTYFSYMNSYKKEKITLTDGLLVSIFLTLGIMVVFLGLGFLMKIGQYWLFPILNSNFQEFNLLMAIILIIFGVLMILGKDLTIFYRLPGLSENFIQENPENGLIASFLLGLAYTAIAAPCAAPIFLSIILLPAVALDPLSLVLIMAVFSIGCGIPFLVVGMAYPTFNKEIKQQYTSIVHYIKPFSGMILLLMSFYLLNNYVFPYYPISIGGYSFIGFNENLVSTIYISLFVVGIILIGLLLVILKLKINKNQIQNEYGILNESKL